MSAEVLASEELFARDEPVATVAAVRRGAETRIELLDHFGRGGIALHISLLPGLIFALGEVQRQMACLSEGAA